MDPLFREYTSTAPTAQYHGRGTLHTSELWCGLVEFWVEGVGNHCNSLYHIVTLLTTCTPDLVIHGEKLGVK
jgi:hypothetical protein